jgi:acyl-CoA reductase-like NAD-dependent aldehyde dehydrogenase
VRCEPVGVVLAITPWNDPLLTPARKLGPALIAGNAVVLKPARQTPLIARWLADQLAAAGLPGGVLGLVTGRDQDISEALLGHPDLDALTFTGSTATGAYLRKALSGRNVRLQTETGGKNASVVRRLPPRCSSCCAAGPRPLCSAQGSTRPARWARWPPPGTATGYSRTSAGPRPTERT